MPRVLIDNREVVVPAGSTLLHAAHRLGLDVPALCWREGCRPNTACMACVMKLRGPDRIVPSCATIAESGMRVESETDEVRAIRRTALDLLLSDHVGECRAPCQYACPLGTDIPAMIRQIAAGRLDQAIVTVRREMALPAVLGRLCPELCERACRRANVDDPASICLLKRYVADQDLASPTPYAPPRAAASGKRVAIVGAGPAGLSAAYFLLLNGHACTLFDGHPAPGGKLREVPTGQLPVAVLDAEIELLRRLGARFETNTRIDTGRRLGELRRDFDAVLLAIGEPKADAGRRLGLPFSAGRLCCDRTTHETELLSVFAAGEAARRFSNLVQVVADGKAAATCVDQFLSGAPARGLGKLPTLRIARPQGDATAAMLVDASRARRTAPGDPAAGLTHEEARAEAERCLHCDCRKREGCKLRKYAEMYGANADRYRGERRRFEQVERHPDVVYEPGKCILCGLCVQIAEAAGEPLGLTLIGRGFDVRIAVPFDEPLADALRIAARQCVEACPTGALAWRAEQPCSACQPGSGGYP